MNTIVKKFKGICQACNARIWYSSIMDEDNDILRVDVADYDDSVLIRDFAKKLGLEFDNYYEHQDHIALSFHAGELRDLF